MADFLIKVVIPGTVRSDAFATKVSLKRVK
jgi:hypothetical protein